MVIYIIIIPIMLTIIAKIHTLRYLFLAFSWDSFEFSYLSFLFRRGLNFFSNFSISSRLRSSSSSSFFAIIAFWASFLSFFNDSHTLSHSTAICSFWRSEQRKSFLIRLHLHHNLTFLLHPSLPLHSLGWQSLTQRWPHGYWNKQIIIFY